MTRVRTFVSLLGLTLLISCGGGGSTSSITILGYTVVVKTAPPTSAETGASIPVAFTVTENESDGSSKPAGGKSFTVAVTAGGGKINGFTTTTITTAADGSVAMGWVLGPSVGTQTVRGSVSATEFLDVNVTATLPAVATVTLSGSGRLKVGDSYAYTLVQKLADGTVVARPITWGIQAQGTALVTTSGVVTALQAGTIRLIATIDGVNWYADVFGYDWTPFSSATTIATSLESDVGVANYAGSVEYPFLLVGCVSGTFVFGVGFSSMQSSDGNVSYAIDSGASTNELWYESPPDYSTLGYSGATNLLRKNFASALTTHHIFAFTFGEYLTSTTKATHTTSWRLTGMTAAIAPAIAACPLATIVEGSVPDPFHVARDLASALRVPSANAAVRLGATMTMIKQLN